MLLDFVKRDLTERIRQKQLGRIRRSEEPRRWPLDGTEATRREARSSHLGPDTASEDLPVSADLLESEMLIDIGYVIFRHPDLDAYVVGGITDHITPWKGALLLHPPSRRPPGPAKHPSRTGFSC